MKKIIFVLFAVFAMTIVSCTQEEKEIKKIEIGLENFSEKVKDIENASKKLENLSDDIKNIDDDFENITKNFENISEKIGERIEESDANAPILKFCKYESDCACGTYIKTGECFYGNKKYVNVSMQCPDFCSGIAANLKISCVKNQCRQSGKSASQ